MWFKKHHVDKILAGEKTQTRRSAKLQATRYKVGRKCGIRWSRKEGVKHFILITGKRLERLGDITPEDARKEGGYTLEEFRREWEKINRRPWDPRKLVWVYDFKLNS